MSFQERVAEAITKSKKPVKEIAKEIGVSSTSVCYYKLGKAMPKADNLLLLAKALDVSVYWLLSGKEDNYVTNEEHELIKNYRLLQDREKVVISDTIGLLSKRDVYKEILNK